MLTELSCENMHFEAGLETQGASGVDGVDASGSVGIHVTGDASSQPQLGGHEATVRNADAVMVRHVLWLC